MRTYKTVTLMLFVLARVGWGTRSFGSYRTCSGSMIFFVPQNIENPFESLTHSVPHCAYLQLVTEKTTFKSKVVFSEQAGVQGFEPRYSGPKPDVLPLDDTPIYFALSGCVPFDDAVRLKIYYE